ncbi:uncharacterized protein LOC131425900 [Malaya genurostris]|uniref:uncharacterized protein LOC131425900 n=1 Tax=Malaya genurostris TaxID=325434 RepID=UPI0026F3E719|nr:uncharacterized protein LOC131425900 [Malaya genurostris]
MGDMQRRVIGWWPIDARMCKFRIKGRFFNFSIINVHNPHFGNIDDDKDAFYAQLEREYDCCPSNDVKIIIGDLNVQVGQEEELRSTIGKFSTHQLTNENGLRLIDFGAFKNMAIRSTFFQHSLLYRYIRRSPPQTESQIDHVLINGRHFFDIIDVRTYRGANVDSDHYLVMVKLRLKLSVINNARYQLPPRYNIERLKKPDVASAYAQNLEAALPDEGELDVAAVLLEYSKSSHKQRSRVHRRVRGTKSTERMVRRRVQSDFGGEERSAGGNAAAWNPAERGTIQPEVDPHFSGEKRHLEEAECEEMELLYRSQETRKFYKKLNKSRNDPVPRAEMCRDKDGSLLTDEREVIKMWKQHFDKHLNDPENVDMGVQDDGGNDYVSAAGDGNDPAPTLREVKDAMHQLKTNKAAGKDGIAAELIKMGPEKLATCLHRSIVRIWETEQLPEEWKEGVICPIHKKGDHLECENFRAIAILNAAYKVLSQIIFLRLSPKTNEFVRSHQAGFVDGRSTTDQIFTVRQIFQKYREYQVQVRWDVVNGANYPLFIDFKVAYDSIDRIELWKIMDENGFPGKLTRMIKATMCRTA